MLRNEPAAIVYTLDLGVGNVADECEQQPAPPDRGHCWGRGAVAATQRSLRRGTSSGRHARPTTREGILTRTNFIREGLPKGGHSSTHTRGVP